MSLIKGERFLKSLELLFFIAFFICLDFKNYTNTNNFKYNAQIKISIISKIIENIQRSHRIVKSNRIKCNKCNEEFGVKNNEFKSNETLSQLKESHSYLSGEE